MCQPEGGEGGGLVLGAGGGEGKCPAAAALRPLQLRGLKDLVFS